MTSSASSIRTFIGAKDFTVSRSFYLDLGYEEHPIDAGFSYFSIAENIGFYLQDYYVKDWIENSMVFLEVDSADAYYQRLTALNLPQKYPGTRLLPVKEETWGKECFLTDPSGVLWHFGQFA